MKTNYDVIVIGAGSVGLPIAYELSKKKFSVLVIEEKPSFGQGSNKKAIGGIRATHSNHAKIALCKRSIEIYSMWEEKNNYSIDWEQKGYSFVAYDQEQKENLKNLIGLQKTYGLNIDWLEKNDLLSLAPNLNPENLLGGSFSPEDGSASPLKVAFSYFELAKENKVEFLFSEKVIDINETIGSFEIITNKNSFQSQYVVNAAGAKAAEINKFVEINLPILPDSHEAAITEPVEKIPLPMIVDMRKMKGSSSVYFHQFPGGQFILCLTPDPMINGFDEKETSEFLPLIVSRVIQLVPELKNVRIRRTWRGLYPNTPDGLPILGESKKNFFQAIGMCGQGFMLGPSVGEVITRAITHESSEEDRMILNVLSPAREFNKKELLK